VLALEQDAIDGAGDTRGGAVVPKRREEEGGGTEHRRVSKDSKASGGEVGMGFGDEMEARTSNAVDVHGFAWT
jgi:hypothetical protein